MTDAHDTTAVPGHPQPPPERPSGEGDSRGPADPVRGRRPGGRNTGTGGTAAQGGRRADVLAATAGVLLIVAACLIGAAIQRSDGTLHVPWPPLQAFWRPHWGPGTPAAAVVAAACVAYGPRIAMRLPWRALLMATWATAMAWIWSLALIDGWQRGVAGRLTTSFEYLSQLDRFANVHAALQGFTRHILSTQPQPWTTHIAGHPPGATLTFVALDRIGLGGGAWAAVWCITTGASAAVAVLLAVRALGDETTARRAAPFMALSPAAVWIGVSADGYFTAVVAWGLALLALAATRAVRAPGVVALAAGLLLGFTGYLSYGLPIVAVVAAAILALARTVRPLPAALAGAGAVVAAFTLSGFSWWQAYPLLVKRYYEGVGGTRPYAYWVWADLACAVFSAGLAAVAGARRALTAAPAAAVRLRTGAPSGTQAVAVLGAAALLMMLIADLSGMSKAETERIWLPFIAWLLPASALLPTMDHRRWLLFQAGMALLVNHLLLTNW